MSAQYSNQYYEELARLIIKSPSLALRQGEVCFFEGDLEFCNKIRFTVCVLWFPDICADGCATSADLFGNNRFAFLFEMFHEVNDGYRKIHKVC